VLIAFGGVAFLDAVGSAALAYHFRHVLRKEAWSEHLERLAHRTVTLGLLVVGAAAVVAGAVRLSTSGAAPSSPFGTALAGVSVAVLIVLSRSKHVLARRVPSRALRSDGQLSAVGAAQATVTVLGTFTAAVGWHWADPAAAAVIGAATIMVGATTLRGDRRLTRSCRGALCDRAHRPRRCMPEQAGGRPLEVAHLGH
jgi:divalent metal cation (Fe/Co/Zn/Cd) transporter